MNTTTKDLLRSYYSLAYSATNAKMESILIKAQEAIAKAYYGETA